MNTIKELEGWMHNNNVRNTYTPGARYVSDEGEELEEIDGLYIWYYVERGERQNLEYFKSEGDAVRYVNQYLLDNINSLPKLETGTEN
jgi:hypothetical protein